MTDGADMDVGARRSETVLLLVAVAGLWVIGPAVAARHAQGGIAIAYLAGLSIGAVAIRRGAALPFLLATCGAGVTLAAALGGVAGFHPLLVTAALLVAFPLVARGSAEPVAPASRLAGQVLFAVLVLAASFTRVADALRFATPAPGVFFVAVAPLTVVLAACLLRGLRRKEIDPLVRGEALLATATIPALLAGLSLETVTGAVLVANLAVAFLALGRIARGASRRDAASLWEGVLLAGALVVSRLAELVLDRA
ncbi:MAG TPA: hypothetical protein VD838_06465 [Anaeromyxobacteraceae bacterium]|nr:hypothetical protein [Anaeromyxobacteraceae bacterium]